MISAYMLQLGLEEDVNNRFSKDFDEVVRDRLFIGENFNGRISLIISGFDCTHGGVDFGV